MSSFHPGNVSYTTSHCSIISKLDGKDGRIEPSGERYPTPTLISSNSDRTSSLVIFKWVKPLIWQAYLRATMSSHPILLGLPVVVPYSAPISLSSSASWPKISVGYGPAPTLVVYAFATPMMAPNLVGAIPRPEITPPIDGFDDVTNGYVPKSTSSRVALAPSIKIFSPALAHSFIM